MWLRSRNCVKDLKFPLNYHSDEFWGSYDCIEHSETRGYISKYFDKEYLNGVFKEDDKKSMAWKRKMATGG